MISVFIFYSTFFCYFSTNLNDNFGLKSLRISISDIPFPPDLNFSNILFTCSYFWIDIVFSNFCSYFMLILCFLLSNKQILNTGRHSVIKNLNLFSIFF